MIKHTQSPQPVLDKEYSLSQLQKIIQRNDDRFAARILTHAVKLEKPYTNINPKGRPVNYRSFFRLTCRQPVYGWRLFRYPKASNKTGAAP